MLWGVAGKDSQTDEERAQAELFPVASWSIGHEPVALFIIIRSDPRWGSRPIAAILPADLDGNGQRRCTGLHAQLSRSYARAVTPIPFHSTVELISRSMISSVILQSQRVTMLHSLIEDQMNELIKEHSEVRMPRPQCCSRFRATTGSRLRCFCSHLSPRLDS